MGKLTSHSKRQSPAGRQGQSPTASRRRSGICLLLTLAGASLGILSFRPHAPRLIWNFTGSLPVGLYSVAHTPPAKFDLIAIAPAEAAREALDAYSALPAGRVLLKQLAADQGDIVCRTGMKITVNGATAATAKLRSDDDRLLPAWSGCRVLGEHEILVLAPHASSFDGRYFGPIDKRQIIGVAAPLLVFPPPGEP